MTASISALGPRPAGAFSVDRAASKKMLIGLSLFRWQGGYRLVLGAPALLLAPLRDLRVAPIIGHDDALDERVAHDVHLGELAERDPLDALKQIARLGEAAPRALGEIGLRHVARDHGA